MIERLKKILDKLEVDTDGIPVDQPLEPLGLDSLALVRLLPLLEQEFGIVIDAEKFDEDHFQTLNHIAQFLANQGAQ
jgi:acyl carrier protein